MRLGAADLFDLKFLRDARLSPDGCHVAYVVSSTDSEEHFELWIQDIEQEGPARRCAYAGNAMTPRWSPNGRWIAFVGDRRLLVCEFPSLRISEPLTPESLTAHEAPAWSPDSARLAVSLREHYPVDGARRIQGTHFRADGVGFLESSNQRIYEVDPISRAVRCLTPPTLGCFQPEWSPSGEHVLFLGTDAPLKYSPYAHKLFTVAVNEGRITQVLGESWFIVSAHWLPDGERIAVAAARDSTLTIPVVHLWVVNREGDQASLRTEGAIGNIGLRIHHDMPAWDLTNTNVFVVADGEEVFATAQRGGNVEIWRISLTGAVAVKRTIVGERTCIALDANAGADVILFAASDLRSPTELWRATLCGERQKRLTILNDPVLARWPEISVEHFSFQSSDGMEIESWFMGPAARTGPIPTILFIHGGPFGATGNVFRYDFQMLCAHGYGIVFANFRGSSGYTEFFVRAIMGDWGGRAYPDHMGAVDAAVARGFADAERLGVWGPSHGGFATCWIVGHTNRFRAAVAEASVTNLVSQYYLTDIPEVFQRDLGGRPHEILDVYRSRSPITYAHRCITPTMLLHGEEDLRCPIGEAEQFHRALLDVGCVTELCRIPQCSHNGDSAGPLSARQAQNEALLRWFEHYL